MSEFSCLTFMIFSNQHSTMHMWRKGESWSTDKSPSRNSLCAFQKFQANLVMSKFSCLTSMTFLKFKTTFRHVGEGRTKYTTAYSWLLFLSFFGLSKHPVEKEHVSVCPFYKHGLCIFMRGGRILEINFGQ